VSTFRSLSFKSHSLPWSLPYATPVSQCYQQPRDSISAEGIIIHG
jgi:hypothetical protein